MKRGPIRLLLLLALAGGCASGPPAPEEGPRLRSGPMRGYAELTEAAIWVQTTAPAEVRLRYWPVGREGAARVSDPAPATAASHRTALVVVSSLAPGTRYAYEVLLDSGPPLREPHWVFATQPLWQYRAAPPDLTVALGSCYWLDDPAVDRPGRKPAHSTAIFDRIAEKRPDLMLWLGDNVYYRETDFGSAAALRERNARGREEPRLQKLLASASHYAIWDDHDFGPNNAVWTYRRAPDAEEAFRLYWANPQYGAPGIRGIFGQFPWADVDFFLLDDRTYRTAETAADSAGRRMLGPDQLRWLKDALLASEAPFKIVAIGSQVLNRRARVDTLRLYPAEYRGLIDFLVANRVRGVVFVTGDKHHAELIRDTPPAFYTLYDFTSSPLTAEMWLDDGEEENPDRVDGTLVLDQPNFGLLRVTGPCKDRVLTMETWDATGALRWRHAVRAEDLIPPGEKPGEGRGHPGCRWLKS